MEKKRYVKVGLSDDSRCALKQLNRITINDFQYWFGEELMENFELKIELLNDICENDITTSTCNRDVEFCINTLVRKIISKNNNLIPILIDLNKKGKLLDVVFNKIVLKFIDILGSMLGGWQYTKETVIIRKDIGDINFHAVDLVNESIKLIKYTIEWLANKDGQNILTNKDYKNLLLELADKFRMINNDELYFLLLSLKTMLLYNFNYRIKIKKLADSDSVCRDRTSFLFNIIANLDLYSDFRKNISGVTKNIYAVTETAPIKYQFYQSNTRIIDVCYDQPYFEECALKFIKDKNKVAEYKNVLIDIIFKFVLSQKKTLFTMMMIVLSDVIDLLDDDSIRDRFAYYLINEYPNNIKGLTYKYTFFYWSKTKRCVMDITLSDLTLMKYAITKMEDKNNFPNKTTLNKYLKAKSNLFEMKISAIK
jgi:hypothetical protein